MFTKNKDDIWCSALDDTNTSCDNYLLQVPKDCNLLWLRLSGNKITFCTAQLVETNSTNKNYPKLHNKIIYCNDTFSENDHIGRVINKLPCSYLFGWRTLVLSVNTDNTVSACLHPNLDGNQLIELGKVTTCGMVLTKINGVVAIKECSKLIETAEMLVRKRKADRLKQAALTKTKRCKGLIKCVLALLASLALYGLLHMYKKVVKNFLHNFGIWILGSKACVGFTLSCSTGLVGLVVGTILATLLCSGLYKLFLHTGKKAANYIKHFHYPAIITSPYGMQCGYGYSINTFNS
ncbi:MAG: hypothetical protein COB50_03785 [Thiotrichales bacterium]|nr:MAG: hypothetical protein COB50_03785 [Thiotrichales bacterium]